MPAVWQKRSKLARTSCQDLFDDCHRDDGGRCGSVLHGVAPPSWNSAPRAYWLKVSNACPPFSTSAGTSPTLATIRILRSIPACVALQVIADAAPETRRFSFGMNRPTRWRRAHASSSRDSRAALPPEAVVSTVSVRSCTKRSSQAAVPASGTPMPPVAAGRSR